jgi:probable HAF family extracellular repeat protein
VTATPQPGQFLDLDVRRKADSVVVLSVSSLPLSTTAWGFSPDGHRFLVHYVSGGQDFATLYDLTTSPVTNFQTGAQVAGNNAFGFSPNGKYLVYVAGAGADLVDLAVVTTTKASNFSTVYRTTDNLAAWMFSPDDDRFLTLGILDGVTSPILFDLSAVDPSTGNARVIWNSWAVTGASSFGFSPHGKYLVAASLTGGSSTTLALVDTATPQRKVETSFLFVTIPGSGADSFGVARWGFGPDDSDQAFEFAYVTGQNTVELSFVNVPASMAAGTFLALTPPSGTVTTGAMWQFSPCGDVFSMVTQSGSQMIVQLFDTRSGSLLAIQTFLANPFELSTTTLSQIITIGGVGTTLASNTAAQTCTTAPGITALSLDASQVVGSVSVTATVTISAPAPPGGATVTLSSDNAAAGVPGSVVVPDGSVSTTFTVTTNPVAIGTPATVTATLSVARTAVLTVLPPSVSALTVASPVAGGSPSSASVSINGPAPAGGVVITIRSDNAAATPPGSVTLNANETSARFTITTSAPAVDTTATISATGPNASTMSQPLLIRAPVLVSLTLNTLCGSNGGSLTGTVTLSAPAPASGMSVGLTSSNAAVIVPAAITVASSTTGTFQVQLPLTTATAITFATITATSGSVAKAVRFAILPSVLQAPGRYAITDLGTAFQFGGSVHNAAINRFGQVAGTMPVSGTTRPTVHAFLWSNGVRIDLGTLPNGLNSYAFDINDAGDVVGMADVSSDQSTNIFRHAVIWRAGTHAIEDLGTLSGFRDSVAYGVNNLGQIVGQSAYGTGPFSTVPRAFVWDGGQMFLLPAVVSNSAAEAHAINDLGQIVGTENQGNGGPAVAAQRWVNTNSGGWANAAIIDLGNLGAVGLQSINRASAINAAGDIVGSSVASDGSLAAFFWRDGMSPLCGLVGATGVNLAGEAVGSASNVVFTPGYWSPATGAVDLNDVIPPGSGWTLTASAAINDAGQIVGFGTLAGQVHAFLLTPNAAIGNTPAGSNVQVTPVDSTTGASPVTITFNNVSVAGNTTLVTSAIGPASPTGFQGGTPPVYYELATTASFDSATVCINLQGITFASAAPLQLLHYENGHWVDHTVSFDPVAKVICAQVTSFSPFATFASTSDTTPPTSAITEPTAGPYLLKQTVLAAYACADSGSGVATCTGTVPNGGAVDTSGVGTKIFTVNSADNAGNLASPSSVSYTVTYATPAACVLYDQTKAVKTGSAVPVIFELCDANGADVSTSSIVVTAETITRLGTQIVSRARGGANGDNKFRFDATLGSSGAYVYNLSTKGLAAGTYELNVSVAGDPVSHQLQFRVR